MPSPMPAVPPGSVTVTKRVHIFVLLEPLMYTASGC